MNNKFGYGGHTDEKLLLKSQIEILKRKLIDRNFTIVQMEAQMSKDLPREFAQGQMASLRANCDNWQDKYDRLLEAHKRLQKVNQGLEDKLLKLADRGQTEKAKMTENNVKLTNALTTAAQAVNRLKHENECYQKDLNLATNLLQCNPNQYASCKLNTLPSDLHQKAKVRLDPSGGTTNPPTSRKEPKIIRVPIPSFPPSAAAFSTEYKGDDESEGNDTEVDHVSAAILAAIIEEREKERSQRHCPTCSCQNMVQKKFKNNQSSINKNTTTLDFGGSSDIISTNTTTTSGLNDGSVFFPSSSSFDVRAIDVGTQTLPSYIGERGKIASICIYCKSNNKTMTDSSTSGPHSSLQCPVSSLSNNLNGSHNTFHCSTASQISVTFPSAIRSVDQTKSHVDHSTYHSQQQGKNISSLSSSWEWHNPESFDSGAPSTPTSLTSLSSCFTSPGDSPGRFKDSSNFVKPSGYSQFSLTPNDSMHLSEKKDTHESLSVLRETPEKERKDGQMSHDLNERLLSTEDGGSSVYNIRPSEFSKLCLDLLGSKDDKVVEACDDILYNDLPPAQISFADVKSGPGQNSSSLHEVSTTCNSYEESIEQVLGNCNEPRSFSFSTNPVIPNGSSTNCVPVQLSAEVQLYDIDSTTCSLNRPSSPSSIDPLPKRIPSNNENEITSHLFQNLMHKDPHEQSCEGVTCSADWTTAVPPNDFLREHSPDSCSVFKRFPSETSV